VDILKIPLSSIPEHGFPVDADVPVKALQPRGVEGLPLQRVNVRGTLVPVSRDYLFQGRIRGCFVQPCDRCLEEARAPFDVEVTWDFEEGPEVPHFHGAERGHEAGEDEELELDGVRRTFQGTEIDLAPPVWEELVLAAPIKYVCQEDCKGLCPICGGNRNHVACDCGAKEAAAAEANTGLAGLAGLFPDLSQEQAEE